MHILKEKLGIDNLNEIHKIEFNAKIKKMTFAPNNKYLAVLEERSQILQIWDFDKLTNQNEISLNVNNCKELHFAINQNKTLVDFFFRGYLLKKLDFLNSYKNTYIFL